MRCWSIWCRPANSRCFRNRWPDNVENQTALLQDGNGNPQLRIDSALPIAGKWSRQRANGHRIVDRDRSLGLIYIDVNVTGEQIAVPSQEEDKAGSVAGWWRGAGGHCQIRYRVQCACTELRRCHSSRAGEGPTFWPGEYLSAVPRASARESITAVYP